MPLDPRTHIANPPPKASDKAWAYFYKNMAVSLSMLTLTVGGLLLLSYMWGIGFMPDIKLQDMTSVLYAMALIGVVFLLSSASLMACPGLLLAWGRLVYKGGGIEYKWVVLWCMLGALVWLILLLVDLLWYSFILFPIFSYFALWVAVEKNNTRNHIVMFILLVCLGSVVIFSLLALGLWVALGVSRQYWESMPRGSWVFLGVVLIVLVCFAWYLSSLSIRQSMQHAGSGGFILLLFLMWQAGSLNAPAIAAIRTLGLGELGVVRIVVTAKGCHQINAALGVAVCMPPADVDEPVALCPVRLRSRMGSQVLLEFDAVQGTPDQFGWKISSQHGIKASAHVVLDKKELLAWRALTWPRSVENGSANVPDAALAVLPGLAHLPFEPDSAASASGISKDEKSTSNSDALQNALWKFCLSRPSDS